MKNKSFFSNKSKHVSDIKLAEGNQVLNDKKIGEELSQFFKNHASNLNIQKIYLSKIKNIIIFLIKFTEQYESTSTIKAFY